MIFMRWKMKKYLLQHARMLVHKDSIYQWSTCTCVSWGQVLFACCMLHACKLHAACWQCWSESGLVSPAVSPSPQDQSPSPSPSPSGQSPSPSGVSPSPLDQSPESESTGPESESESESSGSESESESASPTEVRVSPDLSPDSAWTHESNNRKVLYFNPTFNHFCWSLVLIIGSQPKFPSFLLTYREINRRKHIGSNHNIV